VIGGVCIYDTTDGYLRVGMFGGSMSLDCFGGFLDQITTKNKGTVVWPSVAMLDCFGGFVAIFFCGFLDQITNYYQKQKSKTKTYFPPEPKTDTTAQLEKMFLQPTCSECFVHLLFVQICHYKQPFTPMAPRQV
jgi:hypothetical protein